MSYAKNLLMDMKRLALNPGISEQFVPCDYFLGGPWNGIPFLPWTYCSS